VEHSDQRGDTHNRGDTDNEQPDQQAAHDQAAHDQALDHQVADHDSGAHRTEDRPPEDSGFGDPRVDAAVARTDGLDERPVEEHVEVFDDVHRSLRDTLDDPEADRSGA
jgi:hypothetical protein